MIKLKILNLKKFLLTVNTCAGAVNLLHSDGRKENINKQYTLQEKLMQQYLDNKKCLPLTLVIPNPSDFLSIVSYYAGDC